MRLRGSRSSQAIFLCMGWFAGGMTERAKWLLGNGEAQSIRLSIS